MLGWWGVLLGFFTVYLCRVSDSGACAGSMLCVPGCFSVYLCGVSACTCVVFQRVPQWCISVYLCSVSACTCVVFQRVPV